MRTTRFLLCLFALVLGFGPANAETKTPYTENFDTWVDLSDVSAYGWGVINYNSYVRFTTGVTGNAIDFYWNSSAKEVLVTPALTGEVSFRVKTTSSYNNALKLYSCVKNEDGTFSQGGEIVLDEEPVLSSAWTTVTIPEGKMPSGSYLGIYGNYVAIDDFTAGSAEVFIPEIKRLSITASPTSSKINCEKGNQYTLPVNITLKNTGNIDLPQDGDNYTVSLLYDQSGNTVVCEPVAIAEPIAAGEEKTFLVNFPVDGNSYISSGYYTYFRVREDVLNNISDYFYVQVKKYFVNYQVKEGTKALSNGTAVDFGESVSHVTKTYAISNPTNYISGYTNGTGPVVISDVTVPQGFSTTLKAGDEIALDSLLDFQITMDTTVPGNKAGAFVIHAEDVTTDFTLNLSGVAIDPNAGLALIASEFPDAGMVNHPLSLSATVKNRVDNMPSVKAELYINGLLVQTSEPVEIVSGATHAFSFVHTPHMAGNLTAKIKVLGTSGDPIETDEKSVDIAEEVASSEHEGIGNNNQRSQYVLLNGSYTNTVTDMIYTAAELGLTAGDKIAAVAFKGYNAKANTAKIMAWIELTDETATTASVPVTPASPNLHQGMYDVPVVGSYLEAVKDVLKFNMAEPMEYVAGKNIRIVVKVSDVAYISGFTPYFQVDNTIECSTAYADNAEPLTLTMVKRRPVLYLSTIKEPATLSGVVKDASSNAGIANVSITLKAEGADVVYQGTSNAEGAYSIPVVQDTRTYTLSVADMLGYNNYPEKEGISFANGNISGYDIVLVPSTALAIKAHNIPATGMKFHDYSATVTVKNQLATDFSDGYTVKLYVDGAAVVSQDIAESLTAGASNEITLTYMPVAAGTVPVYVELTAGDEHCQTDVVSVEIADEITDGAVIVGNPNSEQINAPVNLWYKTSQSETVYTKDKLGGIPSGSLIKTIAYQGRSAEESSVNATMQVWMENTTDTDGSAVGRDVAQMTLVFDGVQTIDPADAVTLTFTLNQPFRYDGSNLRVVVKSVSSNECKTYFNCESGDAVSYCKYADSETELVASSYSSTHMAVMSVVYDNTMHMTGKVVNTSGEPVEGAILTLAAGNIAYSATSTADGTYDVTVVQADKTYSLTATAEGYNDVTVEGIVFANGNITKDIVFLSDRKFVVGETTTICLPEYNAEEVAAAGTFYEFDRMEGSMACFKETTSLVGNTPYLFTAAVEVPFHNMAGYDLSVAAGTVTRDGVTFHGVYERKALVSSDAVTYFICDATGKFVQTSTTGGVYVNPFCAYMSTSETIGAEELSISLEGIVNSVETIDTTARQLFDVYTIDGKLVGKNMERKQLKSGVYIINGTKVVIK